MHSFFSGEYTHEVRARAIQYEGSSSSTEEPSPPIRRSLRSRAVRALALLRGRAPALLLACGVVGGEAAAWFLPEPLLMGAVVIGGLGCFIAPACLRILLVTLLLGLTVGAIVIQGWLPPRSADDAIVLLRVTETPRHPRVGEAIMVGRDVMTDRAGQMRCRAVDLPWRTASLLQKGDIAWMRARLTPITREENPFSWGSSLWRRGVESECDVRYVSPPVTQFPELASTLRERFKEYVMRVGGERRGVGLFLSIAFGFPDLLSDYVERAFTTLGMTHLLVVSGFQVSLVFVWSGWLLRLVSRYLVRGGSRLVGALGGVVVTGMYVYILGGEISVVRAFVAVVMVCYSGIRERSRSFLQRWAVALILVEILWPFSFFDPGVQLTFAALAGIGVGRYLGQRSAVREWIWIALCVWLYTTVVLLPRTGAISFAALLINPLVAGAASVMNCIGGILALCACSIGLDPSAFLLGCVAWLNEWLAMVVLAAAAVPGIGLSTEDPRIVGALEIVLVTLSCMSVRKAVKDSRWGIVTTTPCRCS